MNVIKYVDQPDGAENNGKGANQYFSINSENEGQTLIRQCLCNETPCQGYKIQLLQFNIRMNLLKTRSWK